MDDPAIAIAQTICAAALREAGDERERALFEAAYRIVTGNERAATRLGFAVAAGICDLVSARRIAGQR